jgi:hypothetical protein
MTPTVADGWPFVGAFNGGPTFCIECTNRCGCVADVTAGLVRGEPVVPNGVVYQGSSGSDIALCNQGGVFALNDPVERNSGIGLSTLCRTMAVRNGTHQL